MYLLLYIIAFVGVIQMNITEMRIKEEGIIKSINQIEINFRKRLMDLGIYDGADVILLNVLSFGKLYLLEVDDVEICLRKEDALLIEVEL